MNCTVEYGLMIVVNLHISCSLQIVFIDQNKQRYEVMVCLCQCSNSFCLDVLNIGCQFQKKNLLLYCICFVYYTSQKVVIYHHTRRDDSVNILKKSSKNIFSLFSFIEICLRSPLKVFVFFCQCLIIPVFWICQTVM